MIVRVAVATGQDVQAVARKPYVRTLWTFLHLVQHERLQSLRERGMQLTLATLIALSFHKPAGLKDVHARLLDEAGLAPSVDQVVAQGQALLAEVAEIDRLERERKLLAEVEEVGRSAADADNGASAGSGSDAATSGALNEGA